MSATRDTSERKRATNTKNSARRLQLLAIAARLFATQGYSQTTVRDIADAAGILSGSLYYHFDSKEAILGEILQEFLTTLNATFVEIIEASDSPRQILDGLVRSSFATIHADPHAVAVYQNEANLVSAQAQFDFVARASVENERLWLTVLSAGCKSGVFRDDLEVNLVYRFIRDTVWTSVRWYQPHGKLQHQRVADQYLQILHGGLLAS